MFKFVIFFLPLVSETVGNDNRVSLTSDIEIGIVAGGAAPPAGLTQAWKTLVACPATF